MINLELPKSLTPLKVLCLGAHADDIEIGAGGLLLALAEQRPLALTWCVLSASAERQSEATNAAKEFSSGQQLDLRFGGFTDGHFPFEGAVLKSWFRGLEKEFTPDLVLTHTSDDAHQDHRTVNALTWNHFRNHLILEYEIPKWDGDLGRPNCYQPLSRAQLDKKIQTLFKVFPTQADKDWFDDETFRGLARLRGMECRAADGYAEGFHIRKITIAA